MAFFRLKFSYAHLSSALMHTPNPWYITVDMKHITTLLSEVLQCLVHLTVVEEQALMFSCHRYYGVLLTIDVESHQL